MKTGERHRVLPGETEVVKPGCGGMVGDMFLYRALAYSQCLAIGRFLTSGIKSAHGGVLSSEGV